MKYQELLNTNIKKLRQENNLTQEEFAEKIGISIQGLSNIERNRYQPTADTIDKICNAFKITPCELLLNPKIVFFSWKLLKSLCFDTTFRFFIF